ncbi:hypothetical protein GCM10009544_16530 [Streptomyces stramineus]|uniref:Uncharacterized protein n=1 Tax=Streptomyces stramineus TaxID=173861 RepID=A0ABN0ZP95_9ACTN
MSREGNLSHPIPMDLNQSPWVLAVESPSVVVDKSGGWCAPCIRQFENIWLRTKRYNAEGQVRGGSGGVCYLYFPVDLTVAQRRALRELGIR